MPEKFFERLHIAGMEQEVVRGERGSKRVDVCVHSRARSDALYEPPDHAIVTLTIALEVALRRDEVVLDHPCVDRLQPRTRALLEQFELPELVSSQLPFAETVRR
jgi:hypothetical protein